MDLRVKDNNVDHHTDELSTVELIVRRGQGFGITLKLKDYYNPDFHKLIFTASTGGHADENRGTMSMFGIPDLERSAKAKAVWRALIVKKESEKGSVFVTITPPADAPVGIYSLFLSCSGEYKDLGKLVLLFNPWCPEDSVYMKKAKARQEYVMNEHGVIYRGSGNYIFPLDWDYGQFEDDMMNIVFELLRLNPNHIQDPAEDKSAWCDPIYVGRVISAMINSEDDHGVLEGRWTGNYSDGVSPSHWSGSHDILRRWFNTGCHRVKYGQCWVFAGVMCSVMRALGVPCRVVTNFQSAHDTDCNLTIDKYFTEVDEIDSDDSIWNFHVWVECWMKRPDLKEEFDGWQVLDPTPQELSDGVYRCGPAPVKAIRGGHTDLKYDIPFVFAEVNADIIEWLVKPDGSKKKIWTDTEHVGQNISTKSIGRDRRKNITRKYKPREGSKKERVVFRYAISRDFCKLDGEMDSEESEVEEEETPDLPKISIKFEEVSMLVNGEDVKLNLLLHSEVTEPRPVTINIRVNAKSYTGSAHSHIQSERKRGTLESGKDLCIPVVVPFLEYWKPMLEFDVMKVSAVVSDTHDYDAQVYHAEINVVLVDPNIKVKVLNEAVVSQEVNLELSFVNPVSETLKDCTFTLSGSGLLKEELVISVKNIRPSGRVQVKQAITPYKVGKKTLVVDFDCSVFRDVKTSITINVKENN